MLQVESTQEELLKNDSTYRGLFEEHQDCEKKLTDIASKSLLSEEDEIEIKRLKVHKLALKDRMQTLSRDHLEQAPA